MTASPYSATWRHDVVDDLDGKQPLNANLTTIAGLTPAAGAVMIGDGTNWTADTTPTLTGLLTVNGQIAFPATQNPSANANTLDDYEEGAFSPTVTASSGTITAYTANGHYVKIGKYVWTSVTIVMTTIGTATGVFTYTLPFTIENSFAPNGVGRNGAIGQLVAEGTINTATAFFVLYNGTTAFTASGQVSRLTLAYLATA